MVSGDTVDRMVNDIDREIHVCLSLGLYIQKNFKPL